MQRGELSEGPRSRQKERDKALSWLAHSSVALFSLYTFWTKERMYTINTTGPMAFFAVSLYFETQQKKLCMS